LHPMQVRYQAALRPEGADYSRAICFFRSGFVKFTRSRMQQRDDIAQLATE
jgi:hypothetical protein